ncbi:MAG: AAA family ATPase [Hyphomicrobiales bacterium]|nr:AAA family ATPase [Hyphomicrobiales bacterium]
MRFTRLRLSGFKTFVEPTEFLIEPGLTGVVGPNGCGKSNLVEALRWVMGESSYKSMRASGMDDVIFSGSGRRPGRNTAEVTLTLDNAERRVAMALADADTLEVTRRIEREAGSSYRINGRDVRARDVQLLFADASTGSRSPAMVRQGQIGELIAAKPTARRAVLEEAAGITGLHSRRHEAEIRLKAAEQNLERVEDVLTEFESRVESLKRQTRQAVRYRNLSAEIREAEATIAHLKWREAVAREDEAARELADAARLVEERTLAQARAVRDGAVAAHDLPELRRAEVEAAAALQRLRIAATELDAEERRVRDRLADLDRRLVQLAADAAREVSLADDMAAALARLADEEEELAALDEESAAILADAEDGLAETEARSAEAEAALAAAQGAHAEVEARRRALAEARRAAEERRARLSAEATTCARDLAALDASADDGALDDARFEAETAVAMVVEAEDRVAEAEEASRAIRAEAETARAALAEAERELSRLETEAKTLARMLDVAAEELWPPIVEQISVAPGLEAALAAALGDDLEVSADEGAPVHWLTPPPGSGDPALPAGVEPLATHVRAPPLLARRLAQIGLVARAEGPRLRLALAPGQRLVSREGDLWRWDGLTAAADAPTAAARRLSARNRLAELEGAIAECRERRDARLAARDAVDLREKEGAAAATAAAEALRLARRDETAARDALARLEREATTRVERRTALAAAAARLAAEIDEAAGRAEEAAAASADLPETRDLELALAEARARVSIERAAVAEARAARQTHLREAEARARRRAAVAAERQGWASRAASAERQAAVIAERRAEAEAERDDLLDRPADIEEARARLAGEIAKAETARATAADALALGERAQAEADAVARAALEALSTAREAKGRIEERLVAAAGRRAEIAAEIAERFEVAAEALAARLALSPDAPPPDELATERRLERLKVERDKLGPVNLRAEDELRETETRRDELLAERDELVEAIRRLRASIGTLNREARERLMAAFDRVNGHFRELFTHLFGGGEAELQLVESDDPLEAGLEILARPPGKKPATLTLLSGGEQALTALALIFAVFLTNPAPICVLDEVDAPLDDANVERYCDLLDRMTRLTDTRFVVITHNPITMARMNRLFGVTMSERGVSQLVSVDLERAHRIVEPARAG